VDDLSRLAVVPAELVDHGPLQPTAGRFEVGGDNEVRFAPRFPPGPGTRYAVLFDGAEVGSIVARATAAEQATRVVAIYPSAREVPLNLLKVYVEFSGPMSEGWAGRAVQVRRADDDRSVEGVFLPMEPELWDRSRRRLTLLLDPGRIKRGLAPNQEVGYPLEDGVPIVVAVDRSFRDANGAALVSGAARPYEVGPAVRRHVQPSRWRVHHPRAESTDAIRVDFDRPLDRALLEHTLRVLDTNGRGVDGQVTIGEGERTWRFTPDRRWRPEPYRLIVDPRLEDLAGNSLSRLFDRDLRRSEDAPVEIERGLIDFRPA
jgi:hypothetical protein